MGSEYPFDVLKRKKEIVEAKSTQFWVMTTGYCYEMCYQHTGSLFLCPHTECYVHSRRLNGLLFFN